ncbi:MAG TPA: LamG-like jellyroll fold domain-containing protein [Kofleriaceae bacterium]|nr:LamG-like jellyroll fold domain-containing protein [Kofleriaceae bacterium]
MRGVLILGFVAGCYAPEIEPGGACTTACPGDQVCVEGVCVSADGDGDPSLVAHWRFDDPPADGALDSSGHGHHATCTACPSLVTGKVGGGYRFRPRNGELLVVPDHDDFRGVFTIAAWVFAAPTSNQISILAKPFGGGSGNSWQLEVLDNDHVSLSGGEPHMLDSQRTISAQAWHHVAGTWDGTKKRLYIDGGRVAEADAYVAYDGHDVFLGGDENSGQQVLNWDGVLDELRVYRRVLSDAELAALAR